MMKRMMLVLMLGFSTVLITHGVANALTVGQTIIQADAEQDFTPSGPADISDTQTATSGQVTATSDIDDPIPPFSGSDALATVGGVLKARVSLFSGGSVASSSAGATWTTAFTNNAAVATPFLLDFTIFSGQLQHTCPRGGCSLNVPTGSFIQSTYAADISVNSISLFNAQGTLRSEADIVIVPAQPGTFTTTFTESGTSLGAGPTIAPLGTELFPDVLTAGVAWPIFTDTLLLGTFAPEETFLVSYELGMNTTFGNIFLPGIGGGPCSLGEIIGGCVVDNFFSDPLDVSAGATNLTSNSVREGAAPAAVPEPGTLLLLGSGFAGLVGWRWRQARMNNAS